MLVWGLVIIFHFWSRNQAKKKILKQFFGNEEKDEGTVKELVKFEQGLGADGGAAQGALGVEGTNLKAVVSVTYPIEKVIAPVTKVIDDLVDKLEKLIPGDQTAMAAQVKADARAAIVKALSEQ